MLSPSRLSNQVCIEQLEKVKGLLDPAKVVIAYECLGFQQYASGVGVKPNKTARESRISKNIPVCSV